MTYSSMPWSSPQFILFATEATLLTAILAVIWFSILPAIKSSKKEKIENASTKRIDSLIRTIKMVDALLVLHHQLPFSDMLIAIILHRKLRCLTQLKKLGMRGIDGPWETTRQQYHEHRGNIGSADPLLSLPNRDVTREAKIRNCLKVIAFLKKELVADTPRPEWVKAEIARMTEVHIILKIHNLLAYAEKSSTMGREGIARQSLEEAKDLLIKNSHYQTLSGLKYDVIAALERHNMDTNMRAAQNVATQEPGDGLDKMFGQKQGW